MVTMIPIFIRSYERRLTTKINVFFQISTFPIQQLGEIVVQPPGDHAFLMRS